MAKNKGPETSGRSVEELITLSSGKGKSKKPAEPKVVSLPQPARVVKKSMAPSRSVEELIASSRPKGQRKSSAAELTTKEVKAVSKSSSWLIPGVSVLAVASGLGWMTTNHKSETVVAEAQVSDDDGNVFHGKYDDPKIEKFHENSVVSARIEERLRGLDPKTRQDELSEREHYRFGIASAPHGPFDPYNGGFETRDQRMADGVFIQPYDKVKDLATESEYFAYLLARVTNPDDASELANHAFIPYDAAVGELHSAANYVGFEKADCEGSSVLACEAVEALGDRTGKNYHTRILTQGNLSYNGHAICAYEDEGKIWIIDQSPPYQPSTLKDPFKISLGFVPQAENTGFAQEWVSPRGYIVSVTLDKALEMDHVHMEADTSEKGFDYKNIDVSVLPEGWEAYRQVDICYGVKGTDPERSGKLSKEELFTYKCPDDVTYVKGVLARVTYKEGPVTYRGFDDQGRLASETYREGNLLSRTFDAQGRVVRETYKKGEFQYIMYDYASKKKTGYKFSGDAVALEDL